MISRKRGNIAIWSQFELALISAVKKYPILYNKQNVLLPDEVKENCWIEIAMEVGIPKDKCRRKWAMLRNGYARFKQSGLRCTKYDNSTLSFLDPELEEIQRRLRPTKNDPEKFDSEIATNQPKNTTIIPLLASDDDEPGDFEDLIISQHISINSANKLPPSKQLRSGHSIEIQSPSSPTVQKSKTELLQNKGEVTKNYRPHSKGSSLNPRTDVYDSHPVEINKKIHKTKKGDDENDETLIYSNKPKSFKSFSSSIRSETPTMMNLSNEDITRQPIPQKPKITGFGSNSEETNKTHRRPVVFENITLADSDTDDTNSSTSIHPKTSAITNLPNKDIEPRTSVFESHSVEISKTNQHLEKYNCINLEDSDTDDITIDSRCESDSIESAHVDTSTITNSSKNDTEYNPNLSPKTEMPTDESCKTIKSFFNDLSSYIKSKFSLNKQKEIQSRIFSLLISEEQRRHEDEAK